MHRPLIDVHASWIESFPGVETSDTWRWLHLRYLIDSTSYDALLLHFADAAALTAHQILDVMFLAMEALTRTGAASNRFVNADVEWARRTGLALFGAASRTSQRPEHPDSAEELRDMLSFLTESERLVASLALRRTNEDASPDSIGAAWKQSHSVSDAKLQRLVDSCRDRVKSTVRNRT